MKKSDKLLNGNQLSLSPFIVSGRRRRRENHIKNPTFMEGVPGVTPITTQPKLQNIQRKVQDFCGWRRYSVFVYIIQILREVMYIYLLCWSFTYMLPCIVIDFFLNNQQDALIIQIYSVIKLYMFRASSLPIIRSFILYVRHWQVSCRFLMTASKQSQDGTTKFQPDSAWKRSSKTCMKLASAEITVENSG